MESDVEGTGNWNLSLWSVGHGPLGYIVSNNSPKKKHVHGRFEPRLEDLIDELNKLKTVCIIFFDDPVGQALAGQEYMPKPLVAYVMHKHGYTLSEIAIALEFKNTTALIFPFDTFIQS